MRSKEHLVDPVVRYAAAIPGWVWVLVLWAVVFLPQADFRALYWEEGRRAAQAADILATGDWLHPRVFGAPYFDKPPLLPWLIAAIGAVYGEIDEWAVRLPSMCVSLAGALVVYAFLRRRVGSWPSFVGAAALLFTPMFMSKVQVGETDTLVTVATLVAFVLWWNARERGPVGIMTWAGCGAALAVAAFAKGPIPLLFFAATVAFTAIAQRRWTELTGLGFCLALPALVLAAWALGVVDADAAARWSSQMRLDGGGLALQGYLEDKVVFLFEFPAELSPWIFIAVPALVPAWRRRLGIGDELARVLLVYIGVAAVLMAIWPNTRTRYAMPAVPMIAVAAGLAVGAAWGLRKWVDRGVVAALVLLVAYQVIWTQVVVPSRAEQLTRSRVSGRELGRVVATMPGPVFVPAGRVDANLLHYMQLPLRRFSPAALDRLPAPAWIVASAEFHRRIIERWPGLTEPVAAEVANAKGDLWRLFRLR